MAHKNGNPSSDTQFKIQQSQELRTYLKNTSKMLNTQLTDEQLDICIQLCESGVNPEALAQIVKQIREQVSQLKEK